MPLEHIVVRSRTHRVHRRNLIDRARHDDEWNLDADFLNDGQRIARTEARQRVVRQHEIDGVRLRQCVAELARRLYAARLYRIPGAREEALEQ